jgi:hypothetical protein
MTNLKLTTLAALLGLVIAGCLPASVLLTVNGNNNIFLAGQTPTASNTPAGCNSIAAGCLPQELDFVPVAGNVLTFQPAPAVFPLPGITGGVSPCATCLMTTSGDGINELSQPPATNISSSGTTISGIQYTGDEMFLIGVFLGASLPATQVASIGDYGVGGSGITPTQVTYAPLVGQTFFVGDGLAGTGTGALQQFIVPTGATRLFLGFADAMFFNGQANMYNDNTGSLAVNLQIMPATVVGTPEPGTIALLALGLAALAAGRKRLFA